MAAIEPREQFCNGSIGILAPKYICLDIKIMILSELEAELLKKLYFGRPFWKMAAKN
jgi:hypothetical protein